VADQLLTTPDRDEPVTSVSRVSRSTLASEVESAIRRDIISGALAPSRRLRAAEMTERYGVSATPLREALQRLAADNLVALGPHLGATVAPVSKRDLTDVYQVREMLEPQMIEQSVRLGDEAWRQKVRATYEAFARVHDAEGKPDRQDPHTWAARHRAFHNVLLEACGSTWLLRFVDMLADHSERYRMLSMRRGERPSLPEHEDIFQAVAAGDPTAAREALRRHLVGTAEFLNPHLPGDDEQSSRRG
jgi:GntR family transcriptional regulator, carbon starvation induced regulator